MTRSRNKQLTLLMLSCYALVLAHAVTSHTHDHEEHVVIKTGQESFWKGLVGLLEDITETDLGDNHFQEYFNFQKQIIISDLGQDHNYAMHTRLSHWQNKICNIVFVENCRPYNTWYIQTINRRGPPFSV